MKDESAGACIRSSSKTNSSCCWKHAEGNNGDEVIVEQRPQPWQTRILKIASILLLTTSATGFLFKRLHVIEHVLSIRSDIKDLHDVDDDRNRRKHKNNKKTMSFPTVQRRKRNMNSTIRNEENVLLQGTTKTENNTHPEDDPSAVATTLLPSSPRLSIVVQLSGEMGNHISKLASGIAVALKWQERMEMEHLRGKFLPPLDMLLRHQDHPKWVGAAANFQACFPNVANLNVSAANTNEFQTRMNQQKQSRVAVASSSSSESLADILDGINSNSPERVDHTMSWLSQNMDDISSSSRNDDNPFLSSNTSASVISFPFLYSNYFTAQDFWMDEYYEAFRRYFEWDYEKPTCCATNVKPYPDETVFHFRNFVQEMPRKGIQKGYEELSPQKVAQELIGHLPPGSKVAMVTRFPTSPQAQEYVHALQKRGLSVRLLQNQTALQDFCFLLSARHEIVGLARSTFFYWAGILGQAQRVRAYSVDSPFKRQSGTPLFDYFNWTHPELQQRVVFELYNATS